jgi:hypothetical protein
VNYSLAAWTDAFLAEITDRELIKAVRDAGKHINWLDSIVMKRRDETKAVLELAMEGETDI